MQLWASRLVNVNIHSIRRRETGRKRQGKKHRKNKGHGKYSKAHAWALTKCKWKRKAPHQHIAIKGNPQDTCKLFSKTGFFSLPTATSPLQLLLYTFLFLLWFFAKYCFIAPCSLHFSPPYLSPFFPFTAVSWSIWVQLPYYHKRETVCHCKGSEVEKRYCLCAHPSLVEGAYSPGCP